jgi:hypothetical protein
MRPNELASQRHEKGATAKYSGRSLFYAFFAQLADYVVALALVKSHLPGALKKSPGRKTGYKIQN